MQPNDEPLSPLQQFIRDRKIAAAAEKNDELLARAQQVRILQCLTMKVGVMACPHCHQIIVDPRPKTTDDDEFTRL